MSFAKLIFLTFESKNNKNMHFFRYQKWPNVLCESNIFNRKGPRGPRLESPQKSNFGPICGPFREPKSALLGSFLGSFFGTLFGPLLDHFWAPFWGPFWHQIGPRRAPDVPKRAIKSFKDPKSYIFKNLKKLVF